MNQQANWLKIDQDYFGTVDNAFIPCFQSMTIHCFGRMVLSYPTFDAALIDVLSLGSRCQLLVDDILDLTGIVCHLALVIKLRTSGIDLIVIPFYGSMHLVSGDRQMNTEMNSLKEAQISWSNVIFFKCVSERGMCCGQYQRMVILGLGQVQSSFFYSPGYTESQVIEVITTFAWLMFG